MRLCIYLCVYGLQSACVRACVFAPSLWVRSAYPSASRRLLIFGVRNSDIMRVHHHTHDKGRVFVTVRSELVRAAAAASDRRFAAGAPLSVFDGVPIAVKDMIRVAGHVMTAGTARVNLKGMLASSADDEIVARFRALGAIIVGTTVMTEFGVTPLGWSVAYNGPRNPHNVSACVHVYVHVSICACIYYQSFFFFI